MSLEKSKGNLYYVRLKTNCGVLYKIGFTTLESVEKRLGYEGSRDVQLIDRVFLFLEFDDAYQIEQELHKLLYRKKAFGNYSNNRAFPLCKNGQTELFTEDVLKMDSSFTVDQGEASALNIRSKKSSLTGGAFLIDKIVGIFLGVLFSPIILLSNIMPAKINGEDEARLVEDEARLEGIICEIKQKHKMINGESLCTEDHSEGKAVDSTETAAELKKRIDAEDDAEALRAFTRLRTRSSLTDHSIRKGETLPTEDHLEEKLVDSTETETDLIKLKLQLALARSHASIDRDASNEKKPKNKKNVDLARQRLRSCQTEADLIADRESTLKGYEPDMQKITGSSKVGEELLDEFEAMTVTDETTTIFPGFLATMVRAARFLPLGYSYSDVSDNEQFTEWEKYNNLFDEGILTKDEFIAMLQTLDKTQK